jgi:hypothetical protein
MRLDPIHGFEEEEEALSALQNLTLQKGVKL